MPSVYDLMYVEANAMSMIFYMMLGVADGGEPSSRSRAAFFPDLRHVDVLECEQNEKASLEGMSEAFGLSAEANDH